MIQDLGQADKLTWLTVGSVALYSSQDEENVFTFIVVSSSEALPVCSSSASFLVSSTQNTFT